MAWERMQHRLGDAENGLVFELVGPGDPGPGEGNRGTIWVKSIDSKRIRICSLLDLEVGERVVLCGQRYEIVSKDPIRADDFHYGIKEVIEEEEQHDASE